MKTMKIEISEIRGRSELECKIEPNIFAGEWLEHKPTTRRQEETLTLYQDAKAKGRLHTFTCMTIDPSFEEGRLVYQKGLQPEVNFTQENWSEKLKDYDPSRNSRQMTRTEYVCRNLFLIQKLVKSGYEIKKAWEAICDSSKKLGNYWNPDNTNHDFEPTGSREVCGFCDLANTKKLLAKDPWDKTVGFWIAGASCFYYDINNSVANHYHCTYGGYEDCSCCVGMLALD